MIYVNPGKFFGAYFIELHGYKVSGRKYGVVSTRYFILTTTYKSIIPQNSLAGLKYDILTSRDKGQETNKT